MAINRVDLIDGTTLINLTDATATADKILSPYTVYGATGEKLAGTINTRSSSDLTASGATVTAPAGYYGSAATKTVASGTEGTPTASKGTVSNHAVTVTPSVTNTAGYISGGTHTGTGVSVSASELVSGDLEITQNGTDIDVTNYETVSVAVDQGSNGGVLIGKSISTPSASSSSITFTGLADEPTSFVVTSNSDLATGASPYKAAAVVYDGTSLHGQTIRNTSNAQVTYDGSGFSMSYSDGTLTITGTNANFQANQYTLVYSYRGTTTINLWRPAYVLHAYFSGNNVLTDYETDRTIYIPCKPNTTYTVKRKARGERYQVAYITSPTITTGVPIYGRKYASSQEDKLNLTITTGADATFVVCYMWDYDSEPNTTPEQALEDVMISEGGVVDTYVPPYITNVYTSSVQVGSNATSITFSNLEDEPEYFSCIFKSNFGTTSGSQRVIEVVYDGTNTYGLEMDSGAKYSGIHWTHTYSNGSLTITSSGSNAGGYFYTSGNYQLTYAFGVDHTLQTKTVTPKNYKQTIAADYEYTAISQVIVDAISPNYILEATSNDLHNTSTDTADYYIDLDGAEQPYSTWTMTDYIPVVEGKWYQIEGYYLGKYNSFYDSSKQFVSTFNNVGDASANGRAYVVIPGGVSYMRFSAKTTDIATLHVYETNVGSGGGTPTLQTVTKTYTPTTSQQTDTITPGSGYDGIGEVDVTINAVSSGSATPAASISATGATVSTGTNTLTLSKTVSNTPQVSAGYIASGTAGNSDVSLTASVNTRSSSDLTASGATVTAPAGYYASQATKSVASGAVTAPGSISGTSASISTGTNTITLTKIVSVTPSVTTQGYVTSGTAGNSSVSLTASATTKGATTYNTSSSDQSIASGTYLTGAQTIKAVTVSGLSADKILSGTTVKIGDANDDDRIASVSGSVTFQTIYSGSSNPSSSTGVNGDIYIKTS